MLKLIFERPRIQIAEGVQNLFKKDDRRKRKDKPVVWTQKDRALVTALLVLTILLSIFFWWQGSGGLPSFLPAGGFSGFGFGETVTIEK